MLAQLHWQNSANPNETELIAQFENDENMQGIVKDVLDRRKGECPEGWVPMICDETSEHFVRAPIEESPHGFSLSDQKELVE